MNVRPRILIVEDNSIVAVDIKARVERMGYEVTDCVTRG
jgi:CheY-like chemotaxis protein